MHLAQTKQYLLKRTRNVLMG